MNAYSGLVRFAAAAAVALLPATSRAHPAWGVVVDADGCVFYSDLARIVRRAADGTETRSPGVHTHALALAPDGGVVGEETEYLGADRYRHRIWEWGHGPMRFGPWRSGFAATEGIHRLGDGSTIRGSCAGLACRIVRDAGTASTVLYEAPPTSRMPGLFVTQGGRVVFVQDDAVYEIDGESTRVVAGSRPTRFGVFADDCGNVIATSYGDAVVELIRDGKAEVVHTSTAPWAPSGVAVAEDGLWVLEFSTTNEARLVKVTLDFPVCSYTPVE
jgi:hypothetical protein